MNGLLVFIEMKQIKEILEKKFKTANSKKPHFPAPPIFFHALVWPNLYGHEAVRHKPKNRQKMHFLCFQAIFELMSDSLTAVQVVPHQCPLHQSILLTKGPIHEIFAKNIENWRSWKMSFFLVSHFDFFFKKKNVASFS